MATVLIVEDNPDNMLLTVMLLESAGHTVLSAVDALGYIPNQAARSLVTQRTDSIALVTNAQPVAASCGTRPRCFSRCSTLIVTS